MHKRVIQVRYSWNVIYKLFNIDLTGHRNNILVTPWLREKTLSSFRKRPWIHS